jgi:hypothetical protein
MRRNPTHAVLKLEGTTRGFSAFMKDRRTPRGGASNPERDWLLEWEDRQQDCEEKLARLSTES